MKVEVPVGYRVGEIANTASVLVDEIVKVEIPGTQTWPALKDRWIMHIRGKTLDDIDLIGIGVRLSYRGIVEFLRDPKFSGIEALLAEPRIIVSADENILSAQHVVGVASTLRWVSGEYHLLEDSPPMSVIFPKEEYATGLVTFNTDLLRLT